MSVHQRAAAGSLKHRVLQAALRVLAPGESGAMPGSDVHRILLSGSMGIGNAVMFEPLLHAIRQRFPGAHLAVAVRENSASAALFRWPGLVDEVILVSGGSRWARYIDGMRLARRGWDMCVMRFTGATPEMVTASILGRVRYRVGHVSSGRFRSKLDWLFNLPVPMGEYDHEVDRYLALAERLGQVPTRRTPLLTLSAEDRVAADRLLERLGLAGQRTLIAFQPGTSGHQQWKRWPTEYWNSLAVRLAEAGFAVIAMGSEDERDRLEEVCRESGAVNAAGLCSLPTAAAVLARCELLVCTDSALMHIAAAVGAPVVAIFGPTDRTRTSPYGPGHTVIVPRHCRGNSEPCLTPMGVLSPHCTWRQCMRSIGPDEVMAAILNRSRSLAC